MAATVVDRTWRDAAPDAVEAALGALWREVGARLPSARAVMSNLVVVCGCRSDEEFNEPDFPRGLPIDEVVGRHPSRLIVLAHEHGCAVARAPVAARVGIATFGPPTARYSVEAIAVRSSCGDDSMASLLRRLVRGDLPTSIWWADDLSQTPPMPSFVAGARQLIYDSRSWRDVRAAIHALQQLAAREPQLDFADLNWRRLTPVRRALQELARALPLDALAPAQIRIACRRGDGALAWLLGGWLAARVGWPPASRPRIDEASADAPSLRLTIGAGGTTIALTDDRLVVSPPSEPPYTSAVPREGDAEAIAAELRALAPDRDLRDVVGALWRAFSAEARS